MPELGIAPHKTVFVSGIGCSGRFTYYMDTYGMHGIHGRAPAIATGIATARPDLSVWVVTGDGDGLSIGGNHLIHALRRNVNLKILLFNNQIYGLTKGQYSPTREEGKVTKSTPFGSVDHPFNPIALALGAEATFVARTIDNDRQHLTEVLRQAAAAPRDGVRRDLPELQRVQRRRVRPAARQGAGRAQPDPARSRRADHVRRGQPLRLGRGERPARDRDTAETPPGPIVVHDVHGRPSLAFALAHLSHGPTEPTCIGVFRNFERPVYGEALAAQIAAATERLGRGDLRTLLHGGDTWTVS